MKKSDITKIKSKEDRGFLWKWLLSGLALSILAYLIPALIQTLIPTSITTPTNDITDYLDLPPIMPPSGNLLRSLAIPRVSGTAGNILVRSFIKSQFPAKYWHVEEDSHVIDSVHGQSTNFVNLIVTLKNRNSSAKGKRLILAAHYDSKLLEAEGLDTPASLSLGALESKFVGASDSAWSCALMIAIAKAIAKERSIDPSTSSTATLQLIFFDGEEAVKQWSPTDSLYGSRALATKWSTLPVEAPNSLANIELMVLLDLLGTKDGGKLFTFHPQGTILDEHFNKLVQIERDLVLKMYNTNDASQSLFSGSRQFEGYKGAAVEDDHTPFLPFNVPVLHLIPLPFPSVWHTPKDTIDALDAQVCELTARIVYNFIRNKLRGQ